MVFTCNDVLLHHNENVLSYAVDSVGNRRFQVYLDIYRSSFLSAEERKDTVTCNKIMNNIVNTICATSEPKGRFLEFDKKKKVWYNIGCAAVPCQRTRLGLLGLVNKTISNEYHEDKPIVEMSKTRRARTMKALHFNEKMLRTEVNLNDERFKVRDPVLLNDPLCVPLSEMKPSLTKSSEKREKHVTFSHPETSKNSEEGRTSKRRKLISPRDEHVDVICGGVGGGILFLKDKPGNRLFHSLIDARRKNYSASNDKDKFKEVCKVIKCMQKICPACRFMGKKANSDEFAELSFQEVMEKTIQTFYDPCNDEESTSDAEIESSIVSLEETDMYDSYLSDILHDVPDHTMNEGSEVLKIKDEYADDNVSTIIIEESKAQCDALIIVEDSFVSEKIYHPIKEEEDNCLDIFFPEVNENISELQFIESILA